MPGVKYGLGHILLLVVLGLGGCARKDAGADPQAVEDAAERQELFGDRAAVPGITWRSSGLGIRVLQPGAGAAITLHDRVRLHYTGRLKDGAVFDSSRTTGKPADFVVQYLVPGMAAALVSLRSGAQAELFIPPELGYGNIRRGNIPANAGLVFEVEILAVNP